MYIQSGQLRPWVLVTSLIALIAILTFIAIFKKASILNLNNNHNADYGVFLNMGLLDSWELSFGKAKFSIQEDNDVISEYKIYISKQTKIFKSINTSDKGVKKQILQVGDINEIKEGVFVEVYLHDPYIDTRRSATTIIYWE